MRVRELDDRHLPRAAQRLRSWLDRLEGGRDRVRDAAGALDLAALDTRYGGTRPVAVVTARPVVGLAVAAAVLVAGVGVAVVRESGPDRTSRRPGSASELLPQGDAPSGALLGPAVGANVRDYTRAAADGLLKAVAEAPNVPRIALVSLTSSLTPEQAVDLSAGFGVARVFLRAKGAGVNAAALPIEIHGSLLPALRAAYTQTATARAQAQRSYEGYVATLHPRTRQDRAFRDLYAAFARSSGIEARDYAHDCACVYALVVTSTPTLLLTLQARPGVRAVEVAAKGVGIEQVQVQPLAPDVTGTVPRPGIGGLP